MDTGTHVGFACVHRWALRKEEKAAGGKQERQEDILDRILAAVDEENWGPSIIRQLRDEVSAMLLSNQWRASSCVTPRQGLRIQRVVYVLRCRSRPSSWQATRRRPRCSRGRCTSSSSTRTIWTRYHAPPACPSHWCANARINSPTHAPCSSGGVGGRCGVRSRQRPRDGAARECRAQQPGLHPVLPQRGLAQVLGRAHRGARGRPRRDHRQQVLRAGR